jgi:hypothetical protein
MIITMVFHAFTNAIYSGRILSGSNILETVSKGIYSYSETVVSTNVYRN